LKDADKVAKQLQEQEITAKGYYINVMDIEKIQFCRDEVIRDFGKVDILLNAAGGNMKEATTSEELKFFDLPLSALEKVIGLNLFGGAVLPSQVFGKDMIKNQDGGSIINISSMNAFRPLTRIPGYSAAKAAVSNFTQWLAVHFAQEYNKNLRVNAIAPGFFLTSQNRFLLTNKDGSLTPRGETIIAHTPMDKFGDPEDLIGVCVWLASDASKFVTGIIVPVDGGFSAFSGV
jgi:NAD(P)-dependent dehydrogenase (short-subunit alcohol dehydrogenase family)